VSIAFHAPLNNSVCPVLPDSRLRIVLWLIPVLSDNSCKLTVLSSIVLFLCRYLRLVAIVDTNVIRYFRICQVFSMDLSKKIGSNLQIIVNQWFVTQKKFADFFNVKPQTANSWIIGQSLCPLRVLLLIEKMTGITVMQLSTGTILLHPENTVNPFFGDANLADGVGQRVIYLNDSEPTHTGKYLKAPTSEATDELASLKEKVEMLWLTNLHRAGKQETLEAEITALKARIAELEKLVR